jgi:hypothetical protein
MRFFAWFVVAAALCGGCSGPGLKRDPTCRLATFSADITPPVGHALCGGMVQPAKSIADPESSKSSGLMDSLGLSWSRRVAAGTPVGVPAVDFGAAQIVLLPGEAFVDFQLAAQKARPDQRIVALGRARREGYFGENGYCWVAEEAKEKLQRAVAEAVGAKK